MAPIRKNLSIYVLGMSLMLIFCGLWMYDSTTVESRPIDITQNTKFGSSPVSGTPIITQNFHSAHPGLDIVGSGDILAGIMGWCSTLARCTNRQIAARNVPKLVAWVGSRS